MQRRLDMSSTVLPVPEDTSFLGAHVRDGGTSFGLWAPRATRVELASSTKTAIRRTMT